MSSNKGFVRELNKNEIDEIIMQRARAEELSDARTEAMKKGIEKGIEKGQTQATLAVVQKVLIKRLKLSPESVLPRLNALSAKQLEALLDAAFDFESPADFESWLKKNG
ncbi:MAG: DUF4351 domain-containing protein [Proteobacteria bacterium]|nr:DUF4351 domain-containing protein [Pseudomonadota bacterium]